LSFDLNKESTDKKIEMVDFSVYVTGEGGDSELFYTVKKVGSLGG